MPPRTDRVGTIDGESKAGEGCFFACGAPRAGEGSGVGNAASMSERSEREEMGVIASVVTIPSDEEVSASTTSIGTRRRLAGTCLTASPMSYKNRSTVHSHARIVYQLLTIGAALCLGVSARSLFTRWSSDFTALFPASLFSASDKSDPRIMNK